MAGDGAGNDKQPPAFPLMGRESVQKVEQDTDSKLLLSILGQSDRTVAAADSVPDLTALAERANAGSQERPARQEQFPGQDLSYWQQALLNMAPALAKDRAISKAALSGGAGGGKESESLPASVPSESQELALVQEKLAAEKAAGVYGPATKTLLGDYVKWLENQAIPLEITRRQSYGLEFYPSPSFTRDQTGKVSLAFNADSPSKESLERVKGAFQWLSANIEDTDKREALLIEATAKQVETSVRDLGFPRGWSRPASEDSSENALWLKNSMRLLEASLKVREYASLMDDFQKASAGKFPFDLPPGASVERDARGKIVRYNLDLPQSWQLDAAGEAKLAALETWTEGKRELLEPIKAQLLQLKTLPELVPSNSDLELKNRGVRLDQNGRILSIGERSSGSGSQPGDSSVTANLAVSRYEIEHKDGKVLMHQTVQMKDIPVWGYLNLAGGRDVGKPMQLTREYDPEDYVVVRDSHGASSEYSIVQAKDLQSDGLWNSARRLGDKALPAAMDVGLFGLGAVEVYGALRSGKPLAGAQGLQLLRGSLHSSVAAAGMFNNAGARETEWGNNLGTARSAYFVAVAGYATAKGSWSLLKSGATASGLTRQALRQSVVSEAGAASGKLAAEMSPALSGQTARSLAVDTASKSSPQLVTEMMASRAKVAGLADKGLGRSIYTGSSALLVGSGALYSPYIVADLVNQSRRVKDDPSRLIERQARKQ